MSASLANISLSANIFLASVTAYYTFLTQRLVAANKRLMDFTERQMEAQQRPYIEISALVREGTAMFQLRIANTGATSARNLSLTLTPDFYRFHEKTERNHLQRFHPFAQVIPSFPPKSELVFDLGVAYRFFQDEPHEEITPPNFLVRAAYNGGMRFYEEETAIDLRMFGGTSAAAVGSLQELKSLNKHFEELVEAVKNR